jgi:MYXO-CTERM domain-containing protein
LVGNHAGALWAPGRDAVTFGRGARPLQTFGGHRFGRCGAWAEDALWIPSSQGGNGLAVLELSDVEVPTATVHDVGSSTVQLAPPCLAARGSDLLLVGNDDAGNLFVARTTVADVRANRPAIRLNLPPRPAARAVIAPVVAPTPTGWQLAWESPDDLGSAIVGMQIDLDGTPHDGSLLAPGLEARTPVLVPSPGGAVGLIWQQFLDRTGNVVVKARLLPQLLPADGGVSTGDGGVSTDGGSGTDGGSNTGDGGVSAGDGGLNETPIVFTTCGCQSGGAPVVLALALLLVAARRRRAP